MSNNRGYSIVALDNPKFDVNVGSALRAASCYGASMVIASGRRFSPGKTDTQKVYRHIPFLRLDDLHKSIPFDCVPVGVDLVEGALSLCDYVHPERAFYIFGAEDATLGKRVLSWCRDTVYVPTMKCMNLAACVNVVLYDRMCKRR